MGINIDGTNTIKQSDVVTVRKYLSGEFISENYSKNIIFSIDYCQRAYEWKQEQVQDLLGTIFLEQTSEIGNVITQRYTEDGINDRIRFSLLDGQQRTTTLSLISFYLYSWFKAVLSGAQEKRTKEERLKGTDDRKFDDLIQPDFEDARLLLSEIKKTIFFTKDKKNQPRLIYANSKGFDYFYDKILSQSDLILKQYIDENDLLMKKKTKEIIKIYKFYNSSDIMKALDCIYYINEFFNTQTNNFYREEGFSSQSAIDGISNYIRSFFDTYITVENFGDKINSSLIFGNRNNKGLNLHPVDILKNNFILSKQKCSLPDTSEKDIEKEINAFFREKSNNKSEKEFFSKYIYSLFKVMNIKEAKEKSIASSERLGFFLGSLNTNSNGWNASEILKFYNTLNEKYVFFEEIVKPETKMKSEFYDYLYIIKILDLSRTYLPILLRYHPEIYKEIHPSEPNLVFSSEKKNQERYISILQDIIKLYFLVFSYGKTNFDVMNSAFNISSLNNIFDEIEKNNRDLYSLVSDKIKRHDKDISKTIEDYNNSEISITSKSRLGVLYLYELSLRADETTLHNIKNGLNFSIKHNTEIEHIIPFSHYKKDKEKNYITQIGNLLLLNKKINNKCSDTDFKNKKELYKDGALLQATEILKYDNFSAIEDVQKRNEEIIKKVISFVFKK